MQRQPHESSEFAGGHAPSCWIVKDALRQLAPRCRDSVAVGIGQWSHAMATRLRLGGKELSCRGWSEAWKPRHLESCDGEVMQGPVFHSAIQREIKSGPGFYGGGTHARDGNTDGNTNITPPGYAKRPDTRGASDQVRS